MRHDYAKRLAIVVTVLLTAAAALFALGAVGGVGAGDRIDDILAVEADVSSGEEMYVANTDPPCSACHTLAAAGAESDRAVDLDEMKPTRREVIASIVGGRIGAHEAQDYRIELSDRELADLAAFVEASTGNA
jgi:cytochrome c6